MFDGADRGPVSSERRRKTRLDHERATGRDLDMRLGVRSDEGDAGIRGGGQNREANEPAAMKTDTRAADSRPEGSLVEHLLCRSAKNSPVRNRRHTRCILVM